MSQPNAGTFTAICLEEDHTLILQGDPDGRYSSFGRARITFRLSPLDSQDGQAGASGKHGLGQSEQRPSGAQLSGCNRSLLHHDRASADFRIAL